MTFQLSRARNVNERLKEPGTPGIAAVSVYIMHVTLSTNRTLDANYSSVIKQHRSRAEDRANQSTALGAAACRTGTRWGLHNEGLAISSGVCSSSSNLRFAAAEGLEDNWSGDKLINAESFSFFFFPIESKRNGRGDWKKNEARVNSSTESTSDLQWWWNIAFRHTSRHSFRLINASSRDAQPYQSNTCVFTLYLYCI